MIEFLYKWQALTGAFLGGVFALAAALVVALRTDRRQDLAAGMLVVSTLAGVRAAHNTLSELKEEEGVQAADEAIWMLNKLVWMHPPIANGFEGAATRIDPLNVSMAAHLDLFLTMYRDVVERVERVKGIESEIVAGTASKETIERVRTEAQIVQRSFSGAKKHADCAELLVTKMVLSKFPTVHKLRRLFSLSS